MTNKINMKGITMNEILNKKMDNIENKHVRLEVAVHEINTITDQRLIACEDGMGFLNTKIEGLNITYVMDKMAELEKRNAELEEGLKKIGADAAKRFDTLQAIMVDVKDIDERINVSERLQVLEANLRDMKTAVLSLPAGVNKKHKGGKNEKV